LSLCLCLGCLPVGVPPSPASPWGGGEATVANWPIFQPPNSKFGRERVYAEIACDQILPELWRERC
jgi:hypothetical protein